MPKDIFPLNKPGCLPRYFQFAALLCAGCTVLASWAGTESKPKPEYGTPDQHEVHVVSYRNGAPTGAPLALFSKASSPEAIVLTRDAGSFKAGQTLLYFVDFSQWDGRPHTEFMAMVASENGLKFGPKNRLVINPRQVGDLATDVSLVQLADGRLRIYFMTPGSDRDHRSLRSAIGTDGIHFEVEPAMEFQAAGNPEVFLQGNQWVMLISDYRNHQSDIATSLDGLHWRLTSSKIPGSGVGVLIPNQGGGKAMVFAENRGIQALDWNPNSLSTSASAAFRPFQIDGAIAADPSPVFQKDGTVSVYFKYQNMRR